MRKLFLDYLFLFTFDRSFLAFASLSVFHVDGICHKGRLIYRYSRKKEALRALFVVLGELETLANSDYVRCNGPPEAY